MVLGALLAGGSGSRIKKINYPKQFMKINDIPIIIYTLKTMLEINKFDYIYIAVHSDYMNYMNELIKLHFSQFNDKIRLTTGGVTRFDSILNIIKLLLKNHSIKNDDVIVIHDAVRPFVTKAILEDNIKYVLKYDAVVTTYPVSDTMICSTDGKLVDNIPDRTLIYHGQSPDSFRINHLIQLLNNLTESQKETITGTSQISTFNNDKIYMVKGDSRNLKITTDSDLLLAEMIIKNELNKI